jgi:drug/metabolite transporter (DMT)-like permease
VRAADALRLAALAAIWGAAFIFIRVAAPVLGPLWTTEVRLLIGAGVLFLWFVSRRVDLQWRRHLGFYALIGVVGTAIPFTLFSYAGMALAGSTMAILNTTAPMFALLIGAVLGWERLSAARVCGVVLGAIGVWLVTLRPEGTPEAALPALAVAACLCASLGYAVTSLLVRRWGRGAPSAGMALGAQVFAAAAILPFVPLWPPSATPSPLVIANVVALGLLGSGVAYVLFFRLIADVGAASAQTVSLLIPAFGMFWGMLFLGETIGLAGLAGAACIVLGTVLITRH